MVLSCNNGLSTGLGILTNSPTQQYKTNLPAGKGKKYPKENHPHWHHKNKWVSIGLPDGIRSLINHDFHKYLKYFFINSLSSRILSTMFRKISGPQRGIGLIGVPVLDLANLSSTYFSWCFPSRRYYIFLCTEIELLINHDHVVLRSSSFVMSSSSRQVFDNK